MNNYLYFVCYKYTNYFDIQHFICKYIWFDLHIYMVLYANIYRDGGWIFRKLKNFWGSMNGGRPNTGKRESTPTGPPPDGSGQPWTTVNIYALILIRQKGVLQHTRKPWQKWCNVVFLQCYQRDGSSIILIKKTFETCCRTYQKVCKQFGFALSLLHKKSIK